MDRNKIQSLINFDTDDTQDSSTGFISVSNNGTDTLATLRAYADKNVRYLNSLKEELWNKIAEVFDTYGEEDVFKKDNYGYYIYKLPRAVKVVSTTTFKPISVTNIEYKPDRGRIIISSDKTSRGLERDMDNASVLDLLKVFSVFVSDLSKKLS